MCTDWYYMIDRVQFSLSSYFSDRLSSLHKLSHLVVTSISFSLGMLDVDHDTGGHASYMTQIPGLSFIYLDPFIPLFLPESTRAHTPSPLPVSPTVHRVTTSFEAHFIKHSQEGKTWNMERPGHDSPFNNGSCKDEQSDQLSSEEP